MTIRFPAAIWRRQAGLALVCFSFLAPLGLSAKSTWLKLEAPDFVAYSDAPEHELTAIATDYAAYRLAFRALFLTPDARMSPSVLLLFQKRADFEANFNATHAFHRVTASCSLDVDGTPLMSFSLQGDRNLSLVLSYEADTIWNLKRIGYYVPIWMSQGAGEVLSTLLVRKDRCVIGRFPDAQDYLFTHGEMISWPRFFEISQVSPEYQGDFAKGQFHAQAWALMHWILLGNGASRERFAALAGGLRTAASLPAVEEVLHVPAKDLHATLLRHLSRNHEREIPFDAAALRASFKIGPAPAAEVLVLQSDMLAGSGRPAEAGQKLAEARQLAPHAPLVLEALARQAVREQRSADAALLYREAIAAGTASAASYLHSAEARLNESSTEHSDTAGGAGTNATVALQEIQRALALNPGDAAAYRLLGRACFVAPTFDPGLLAALSPRIDNAQVRYYRALLYWRLGRLDACLADVKVILDDPNLAPSDRRNLRSSFGRLLVNSAAEQSRDLAHNRRFAEARRLLQTIPDDYLEPAESSQREDALATVDEWEVIAHLNDLSDQERWAELESCAREFLAAHPHAANRDQLLQFANDAAEKKSAAVGGIDRHP